jgi:flavin-dependent dehydrogenase
MDRTECVVVGAGVIGLACARRMAMAERYVCADPSRQSRRRIIAGNRYRRCSAAGSIRPARTDKTDDA